MRALLAAALVAAACHVSDATAPRAAYIGMASIDVGIAASVPPVLYCALRSDPGANARRCGAVAVGISAAAAVATGIALANQDYDRDPGLAEWLVVATPTVALTGQDDRDGGREAARIAVGCGRSRRREPCRTPRCGTSVSGANSRDR